MDFQNTNDSVTRRVRAFTERVARLKEHDLYYLNMPVEEILPDSKVRLRGREHGDVRILQLPGAGRPPAH